MQFDNPSNLPLFYFTVFGCKKKIFIIDVIFSHSDENTYVESCPCLGKMDKMFRRLDNFWQLAADGSSDIRTRDRYWLTWFIKKVPNHILLFIFMTCAPSIEKWFLNKK